MFKIPGSTRSVQIKRGKILCFNNPSDSHETKTALKIIAIMIKGFVPVFFLDRCFKVGNNLKENEDSYCAEQYARA